MEGLVSVFSGKAEAKQGMQEEDVEKLHAKIGPLVVERDFFGEGLRSMSIERRRAWIEPSQERLSVVRHMRVGVDQPIVVLLPASW